MSEGDIAKMACEKKAAARSLEMEEEAARRQYNRDKGCRKGMMEG